MYLKKLLIWLASSQLLVILFSFIFYRKIDLLGYINVSFIIGTLLVLAALTGFVIKGRFFDIVFRSFQYVFSRMEDEKRRPLSQLIPQNYQLPFVTGVMMLVFMAVMLIIYQ
ncbi:DUF3899 domain-containing protein [Virgibacillus sp. 179-BFC.A HS]|uniref:DUF3899 domain-containing protein n=1 Tax=Tigheibacillus jepli TaxID=3035914 RepID=A0ABU5CDN7_9BACI|nr:DUF3899 domain-containing protein [Virgibacillus sp. 179-BFC.A HS]MDY0404445.1 DUF3899 domain-containing protein [Virgibacillus sp. 179-BFC.A HS]